MELPSFRKKVPKEPKFDTEDFYKSDGEMGYVRVKNLELKKILEKVDVNVLIDIFMEIYKKAVRYDEKDEYELFAKFSDRLKATFVKNINVEYSGRMGPEYAYQQNGSVKVNSKILEHVPEVGLLKIVVHEFVHNFSGQGGMGLMYRGGDLGSSYLEDNRLFFSLNEAITEIIADYILMEYIKRSGNKSLYKDFNKGFEEYKTYFFEQLATQGVVKTLAKEVGIPEDVVLESLFGHYVRGDFEKVIEELTEEERGKFKSVQGMKIPLADSLILLLKRVVSR